MEIQERRQTIAARAAYKNGACEGGCRCRLFDAVLDVLREVVERADFPAFLTGFRTITEVRLDDSIWSEVTIAKVHGEEMSTIGRNPRITAELKLNVISLIVAVLVAVSIHRFKVQIANQFVIEEAGIDVQPIMIVGCRTVMIPTERCIRFFVELIVKDGTKDIFPRRNTRTIITTGPDYNGRFALRGPQWEKTLLATDLSRDVLAYAKRGVYPTATVEALPEHWQRGYFRHLDDAHMQVVDAVRRQVLYRPFNLMSETFPFRRPFHVIFCRNVMIYFDALTRRRLVQKFADFLVPGGYLFIGHSEVIDRQAAPQYDYVLPSVYRKKQG